MATKEFSADYIFTGKEVIKDATVVVTDMGQVVSIEMGTCNNHYNGGICPGFINAHCHLELSFMFDKIDSGTGLIEFVKRVVAIRNDFSKTEQQYAIRTADRKMWENGIQAVGDISNDERSFEVKSASKLRYHTFVEVFDLHPSRTEEEFAHGRTVLAKAPIDDGNSASLSVHAPYSSSPELYQLVDDITANTSNPILSVHNQENEYENEFFLSASGPWRELIEQWGFETSWVKPYNLNSLPAMCQHLSQDNKLVLVHNTFTSVADVQWANKKFSDLFFCTCPMANMFIEQRLPDYDVLLEGGATMLVGTDSLASNYQLSILEELKLIKKHNPRMASADLIRWATFNGAQAFNWPDLGVIEEGSCPGLLHIDSMVNGEISDKSSVHRLV